MINRTPTGDARILVDSNARHMSEKNKCKVIAPFANTEIRSRNGTRTSFGPRQKPHYALFRLFWKHSVVIRTFPVGPAVVILNCGVWTANKKKIGKKVFMHDKKLGRFLERRASNQSLGGEGKVIVNFEETVYNIFNYEGKVAVRVLIKALDEQGIKLDDPRLREFTDYLSQVAMEKSFESEDGEPVLIENLTLEKSTFISLVKQNRMMLSKALRSKFVLPEFRKFCAIVKQFFLECKSMELGGQPYPLIRQTASINPDAFGISICSTDGQRFSIGDAKDPFLLLSCSNVLTYSLARTHLSSDEVHEYVGQEPSGRNCSELAVDSNNRPHNPMIDAGGIMIACLLQKLAQPDMKYSEVFEWVFSYFKKACGGLPLTFNNSAYIGLRHRADGNYAQAFYMRETKSFPSTVNLESCMELYLQCRAMEGTCEALAVVAATLANGGINPITGETVLSCDAVTDTLSLMHSCGLKGYSGKFAFEVGMTAKAAESGAIMVVVPNVLGFCVWSPPVDKFDVSTRGLKFCQKIVTAFPFHHFDNAKHDKMKSDPCMAEVYEKSEAVVAILFSAASGDVTAMRRFFMSGMNLNTADYDGRTPLHLSAAEGHTECVEFLVKTCKVDPNSRDRWGQTPLDDAKLFNHQGIIDILRQAGALSKDEMKSQNTIPSRTNSISSEPVTIA